MFDQLRNPWALLIIVGYLPGIIFFITAFRIYRRGETTMMVSKYDPSRWYKPVSSKPKTLQGKEALKQARGYVFLGFFISAFTTLILLSVIIP